MGKNLKVIPNKQWVEWKSGSGKFKIPGKTFYLKLAAAVGREVCNERDKDGVPYVRKAMMGSSIALKVNW